MVTGSEADLVAHFAGAQRDGIGRLTADPATDRWCFTEAVNRMFGAAPRDGSTTWDDILGRIPGEERALIEAAYRQAGTRPGPFSWSHRINADDGQTRSILLLGTSVPDAPAAPDRPCTAPALGSCRLRGYVIDMTDLRLLGASAAATEAVKRSSVHRAVIEQAKGVLVLAHGLDADSAFALLAWHSQQRNIKVHILATQLIEYLQHQDVAGAATRKTIDRLLAGSDPVSARHSRTG